MSSRTTVQRPADLFGEGGAVRVLLASDRLTARLVLEAVLEKGGYWVDSAVSAADAMEKAEQQAYDLVLCDLESDSTELRRFAAMQPYRPATANVHVSHDHVHGYERDDEEVLIAPVDIPRLLTQIADLIANRAYGRSARAFAAGRRKTA